MGYLVNSKGLPSLNIAHTAERASQAKRSLLGQGTTLQMKDMLEILSQIVLIASLCLLCFFGLRNACLHPFEAQRQEALYPLLAAVLSLYVSNLIYSCAELRGRLLFLYLHAGIFLFWLTRIIFTPLLSWGSWWLWNYKTTLFALGSIFLTLVSLRLGNALYELWFFSPKQTLMRLRAHERRGFIARPDFIQCIQTAALLLFLLAFVGEMLKGYIILKEMSGLDYTAYYTIDWGSKIPWVVGVLSSLMPYFFAGFLATLPSRRTTVLVLLCTLISTVPMLKIGSRSAFVLTFIFAAFYYLSRAILAKAQNSPERWISKKLVITALILMPVGVLAMGALNYIRAGEHINLNLATLMADAFYKQGVSFDVLGHGYRVSDKVSALGFKFFSLGGVIDEFTQGFIGQLILGLPQIPDYNSTQLALEGHSYAHTMSYYAHPRYLQGEGYGSAYILELYADFGFAGMALGSLFIAAVLSYLSNRIGRTWFGGMVALTVALNVMHMPRGYVNELFYYLLSNRFWLALVSIYIGALLLNYVGHGLRRGRQ